MSAALQMVLVVEGMFMSSLPPGQLITSRADCVSTCYRNATCFSVFYATFTRHCRLMPDIYTDDQLTQEYGGMEYFVWPNGRKGCRSGYILREELDLCMRVVDTHADWQTAENHCIQDGGHLVKVESDDVNQFIYNRCQHVQNNVLWIGGNDLDNEGVWKWADNSSFNYTAWRTSGHHPADPNGATDQNCVGFRCDKGKWADYDCNDQNVYMCQTQMMFCNGL